MEKPSIFKNPIDHEIRNNEEVYRIGDEKQVVEQPISKEEKIKNDLFGGDIKRKINQIFASPNYIYKANVEIKTIKGTLIKNIIGMNGETLITMENETIPFSEIEDIKLLQ